MIMCALLVTANQSTVAQRRTKPVAVTPAKQMQTLLPRLETKIENLNAETDKVAARGTVNATITDSLGEYLARLDEDVAELRSALDSDYDVGSQVRAALLSATRIDQFMLQNRVSPSASTQWRAIKRDMVALAGYNRISWNWRQNVPALRPLETTASVPTPTPAPAATPFPTASPRATPAVPDSLYTASDTQMSTLLSRIDLKVGIFKSQFQTSTAADTARDETAATYVTRLENATNRLRQQFSRRDATLLDVTDLLTAATYIDQYVGRSRLPSDVQAQWRDLKGEFSTLASYFRQSWNWNQDLPTGPFGRGLDLQGFENRITGTYRLNQTQSDDVSQLVERSLGTFRGPTRENMRLSLERRLRSPEMIAVEMNNRNVSMASSILPRVTFQADGRARTEVNESGRNVSTTATVDEDGLMITYLGQRANDFYLTLLPMAGGKLRVTRRIFPDDSSDSITVTSVYDKIDNTARWNAMGGTRPGDTNAGTVLDNSIGVPVGTRLDAELRSSISSTSGTTSFTMEVLNGQFRRSIISGRVLMEDPRTRVAGRSRALIAFDTITLPNGTTHRFAGDVEQLRTTTGEVVEVTNQTAQQATAAPQRVGGILGALMGAIAGVPPGQGSAASVQGAVLSQRGDVVQIEAGSEISIVATQPRQ